jgi:hypothetical protein
MAIEPYIRLDAAIPWLSAVQRGALSYVTPLAVFGVNPSVGNTNEIIGDVSAAHTGYLDTADEITLVSDSADDDGSPGSLGGMAGTGIGLSIAASLADAYGGSVTLDAGDPDGTVATLRVPVQ